MIRQQDNSDNAKARDLHKYDHLIPVANKVLKYTAKATWFTLKILVKAAIHLPGLVRKAAHMMEPAPKPQPVKNPSSASAFPAP